MGRGERWRAMSGKVMDALHCITKCSNICFISQYRWVWLDITGLLYLVFRCAEAYIHFVQIWYSLIFNGLFAWLAAGGQGIALLVWTPSVGEKAEKAEKAEDRMSEGKHLCREFQRIFREWKGWETKRKSLCISD